MIPLNVEIRKHSQGTDKMSDKKFSGKVAVVTGATSGIGHACALAFANEGAKIVCVTICIVTHDPRYAQPAGRISEV